MGHREPQPEFRVIVMGGIALVADSACGGAVSASADAATDAKADDVETSRLVSVDASDAAAEAGLPCTALSFRASLIAPGIVWAGPTVRGGVGAKQPDDARGA
jgi:hypothetical protein